MSVAASLKLSVRELDCGNIRRPNFCDQLVHDCDEFETEGTGPAAKEIWNSLVNIHGVYSTQFDAIENAAKNLIYPYLRDLEKEFSPLKSTEGGHVALDLFFSLITIGASAVAGPTIGRLFSEVPQSLLKEVSTDVFEGLVTSTTEKSLSIAKDRIAQRRKKWTEESQKTLSKYLAMVAFDWSNMVYDALTELFDGKDENIDTLHALISHGKMIAGGIYRDRRQWESLHIATRASSNDGWTAFEQLDEMTIPDLERSIAKTFFTYAIPTAWSFSKQYAFVIDSGHECDTKDPIRQHLGHQSMNTPYGCYDGKLYYLATVPTGQTSEMNGHELFSTPPGLELLNGQDTNYGGVTNQDFIAGYVVSSLRYFSCLCRSSLVSSFTTDNGNSSVDALRQKYQDKDGAILAISDGKIVARNVLPGGLNILPVCSAAEAFRSWEYEDYTHRDVPLWPCTIPTGFNACQSSSFFDQTSDASPSVSDCKQIIENIKGDPTSTWTSGMLGHHAILKYGSCAFGAKSKKGLDGNLVFKVGSQDVIDIIDDSISKFGRDGKIGAKGLVDCSGNIHDTTIEWGTY